MAIDNLLAGLRGLVPRPEPLIALVLEIHTDQTSTVELPGGGQLRARGTSVAVGQSAYLLDDVIQGIAPAGEWIVIEVG